MEQSIAYLISRLTDLLSEETYDYSFYDFERVEITRKNELYIKLEEIKKNSRSLTAFCDEINSKLIDYDIITIGNIVCGKIYKKSKDNIPLQIEKGYYYSFTVICKKKSFK